jgi:hypothetical protein
VQVQADAANIRRAEINQISARLGIDCREGPSVLCQNKPSISVSTSVYKAVFLPRRSIQEVGVTVFADD